MLCVEEGRGQEAEGFYVPFRRGWKTPPEREPQARSGGLKPLLPFGHQKARDERHRDKSLLPSALCLLPFFGQGRAILRSRADTAISPRKLIASLERDNTEDDRPYIP